MNENKEREGKGPEYQSVEAITLTEAGEGEADVEITAASETAKEALEARVKEELVKKNWWLKKEWQEKGLPGEQFDIEIGDGRITIYNYGAPLETHQIEELQRVMGDFSRFKVGGEKEFKYILINNERKMNPNTTEEQRGEGSYNDSAMGIYPRAMDAGDYRAEETANFKGVSNFEGTTLHELSHLIGTDAVNAWAKKFGWRYIDEPKKLPGGSSTVFETDEPERCVSDYARVNPSEDICESVVAALRSPENLDPEKLQFVYDELLKDNEPLQILLKRRVGEDIELPQLKQEIRYKRKSPSIRIKRKTS